MKFAVACLIANVAAIRIVSKDCVAPRTAAATATNTVQGADGCFGPAAFSQACPAGQSAAKDAAHPNKVEGANCWKA